MYIMSIIVSNIMFCRALGNEYENKLAVRLWQVRQEIEEKGHYDLTYEELVYAARTAWRNAPRCVNRIVWRQLEVMYFSHNLEMNPHSIVRWVDSSGRGLLVYPNQ